MPRQLLYFFLVDLKDDVRVITPLKKFYGTTRRDFYPRQPRRSSSVQSATVFLGYNDLPYAVSLALSYFGRHRSSSMRFNLIDGVDGLAGYTGCREFPGLWNLFPFLPRSPSTRLWGFSLVGGIKRLPGVQLYARQDIYGGYGLYADRPGQRHPGHALHKGRRHPGRHCPVVTAPRR